MISVIVPAFNEEAVIEALYHRVTACATTWQEDYEIIVVDDGSRDSTLALCKQIAGRDPHFRVVSFSRNFGHQVAVSAGLRFSSGDLVAIIDADLQDPPEELSRFFAKCREGSDVVYAIREKRKESLFMRAAYHTYYRILARLAVINIAVDSGDFCVMSRRVVDAINALPERNRFVRGLRAWVGYRQTGLSYERQARQAGTPKYSVRGLINLGMDGVVNFSFRPLRIISVVGLTIGALALMAGGLFLVQYAFDLTIFGYNPRAARGWTSLILALLGLGGTQLLAIGILGEYVGRLFEETKRRPLFIVGETANVSEQLLARWLHAGPFDRRF
jgi:glycosyltransferase involved in cell wall biosynthesis